MPRGYTIDKSLSGMKFGEVIMRKLHTLDSVTDASAKELLRVCPDAEVSCRCGNGECSRKECDAIYAHTKDGMHFATIHGSGIEGRKMADGAMSIFRKASATRDEDRLFQLRDALVELNKRNAEFWRAKDVEA
jgi:hypothetical protein